MRPSTLEERREFYESEFDVRALARWLGNRTRTTKFAMILGRHTGIVTPVHAKNKNDVIVIDDWRTARDVRAYALDYLPEGLYYDRNRYVDVSDCRACARKGRYCDKCNNFTGQQLAFDLDPENIDCPYHGHIGEKLQSGRGLSFCMLEFKRARRQAYNLSMELRVEYNSVHTVFSGRGFHVVVDDEPAYSLTRRHRSDIARKYGKRYAIDEWVTVGGSRLMRLPGSLNAIVSRKCVEIKRGRDLLKFDPRTSVLAMPDFVRSS
jgi:DNA primase catalytic subunit